MMTVFHEGQPVRLTFAGRTVNACVVLASGNGHSLALEFEALLGGYAGMMPVLWDDEAGAFRDLITQELAENAPSDPKNPGNRPQHRPQNSEGEI